MTRMQRKVLSATMVACFTLVAGCGDAALLTCSWPGLSNTSRCKSADVEPAPRDLDAIIHWLWMHYEDATDEELITVVGNLEVAVDAPNLLYPMQRSVSDMSREEVAAVNMDVDPSIASGVVSITTITCSAEGGDRVVRAPNQAELYPGAFDSYQRTFKTDFDGYVARSAPLLAWTADITSTLLTNTFTERVESGLRWVPAATTGENTRGPLFLSRTWLPSPAVFERPGNEWSQDFQIEVFWRRDDTHIFHMWTMWRYLRIGNLSTNDDSVIEIQLSRMVDWDNNTGQLCLDNRP